MSGKYMDFAPRRNTSNGQLPRAVSSGAASARPVVTGEPRYGSVVTCAMPQKKDSLAIARTRLAKIEDSGANSARLREEGGIQGESRFVTRAEEVGEVEDYWVGELGTAEDLEIGELGVVEDLETGAVEDEEDIEEVEDTEDVVSTEDFLAKPKDDRAGFKEGKSPFINTDKLEKRPLSAFRRVGSKGPMPTKNDYTEQKKVEKEDGVPTMVVTGAGRGSSISLAIIIILVAILGAVVGFVMYLAFFQ